MTSTYNELLRATTAKKVAHILPLLWLFLWRFLFVARKSLLISTQQTYRNVNSVGNISIDCSSKSINVRESSCGSVKERLRAIVSHKHEIVQSKGVIKLDVMFAGNRIMSCLKLKERGADIDVCVNIEIKKRMLNWKIFEIPAGTRRAKQ